MDRGAWWAMAHRVTKNQTQLKRLSTHASSYHQAVSITVTGKKEMRGGGEKPRLMVTSPLSHKFFSVSYRVSRLSTHVLSLSTHKHAHTPQPLLSREAPWLKLFSGNQRELRRKNRLVQWADWPVPSSSPRLPSPTRGPAQGSSPRRISLGGSPGLVWLHFSFLDLEDKTEREAWGQPSWRPRGSREEGPRRTPHPPPPAHTQAGLRAEVADALRSPCGSGPGA